MLLLGPLARWCSCRRSPRCSRRLRRRRRSTWPACVTWTRLPGRSPSGIRVWRSWAPAREVRCAPRTRWSRPGWPNACGCLGFELEGRSTTAEVERWGRAEPALVGWSRAAERLRACGRAKDVDFVLEHVDDLDVVCVGGELPGSMRSAARSPRRTTDAHAPHAAARRSGSRREGDLADRTPLDSRSPTPCASFGASWRPRCAGPGWPSCRCWSRSPRPPRSALPAAATLQVAHADPGRARPDPHEPGPAAQQREGRAPPADAAAGGAEPHAAGDGGAGARPVRHRGARSR